MQRRNILRMHISRLIAGKTGKWSSNNKSESKEDSEKFYDGIKKVLEIFNVTSRLIGDKTGKSSGNNKSKSNIDRKKVHVDIPELLKVFNVTKNQITKLNNDFPDHQVVDLYYEDLVNDREQVMSDTFEFLNVYNAKVESDLKRQNPEPMEDLVLNYQELHESLIETEFAFMLTD